jgi:hypothetical protein
MTISIFKVFQRSPNLRSEVEFFREKADLGLIVIDPRAPFGMRTWFRHGKACFPGNASGPLPADRYLGDRQYSEFQGRSSYGLR